MVAWEMHAHLWSNKNSYVLLLNVVYCLKYNNLMNQMYLNMCWFKTIKLVFVVTQFYTIAVVKILEIFVVA
jgi:predicted TIM-barrel fold metal-dependent hydrolase